MDELESDNSESMELENEQRFDVHDQDDFGMEDDEPGAYDMMQGEMESDDDDEDEFAIERQGPMPPQQEIPEGNQDKIENQPFDEAVELSDAGGSNEDVPTSEDDEEELGPPMGMGNMGGMQYENQNVGINPTQTDSPFSDEDEDDNDEEMQFQNMNQGIQGSQDDEDEEEEDSDDMGFEVEGAYDPSEFAHLQVGSEVQELFQYITRYKPSNIEIDAMIKPFVPEFIPAVGEVDAFLKIPRPDAEDETLGLTTVDEPNLNQSDPAILEVKLRPFLKRPGRESNAVVRSIENADKNPKQISKWVSSIEEAHRMKPSPTVTYTKAMPDIDQLMEAWNPQMEEALRGGLELPGPDLDVDLNMYALIVCSLIGIPINELSNGKSYTESLHVLFTLYSDFKANQHFRPMEGMQQDSGPQQDYMQF